MANNLLKALTCIARRLPVGSVRIPLKKHPIGTHSKFIEPVWQMIFFYKTFIFFAAKNQLKII